MRIDIWSDVVCPWCYLGSRRLRAALERAGVADAEIHWRAFQLQPGAPDQPRELRSALERRYGPGAFDAMTQRLTALGRDAGIEYRFDLAQSVGTERAHRLLAWSATQGHQDELAERLFDGYFTRGEDVSSPPVLISAARDVGLDPDLASETLASGAFADVVRADREEAMDRGITGVPAFLVDGRWMLPGAQEVDRMVQLLERAGAATPD